MNRKEAKNVRRTRRKAGVRTKVEGTPARPRLSVNRSLNHMYAQVIDDLSGRTLAAASTREAGVAGGATGNAEAAAAVGKAIASRAKDAGVSAVVFDRGWYRFHGRVKALADAARAEGLDF
ncbi:MAG: 50S ribosomal protein L18 [Phycisphaerales bacterium]